MSIEIRNLSFSYGSLKALQDINLSLREGCFNALLGPHGAGKSTLFSLLLRLFALQSGEISIARPSIAPPPAEEVG